MLWVNCCAGNDFLFRKSFRLEPDRRSDYIFPMNKRCGTGTLFIKLLRIVFDLLTIALLFTLFVYLRWVGNPQLPVEEYLKLWPFLLLFWIVFEKTGLYEGATIHSGASLGPTEEIRRLFYAISAVFISIGFANFFHRPNDYLFSRIVFIGTYLSCLFFIPFNRFLFRKIAGRLGYRGVPAIVIGSGQTAQTLFDSMMRHSEYGLWPVGYFADVPSEKMPEAAPFLGTLDELPEKAKSMAVNYAILTMDEEFGPDFIKKQGTLFPHLLFVPRALLHTSSGIVAKDISGTLGLEVRHNLQIPHIYFTKRCIDFLLAIPCLLVGSLIMGMIALLIKKDSPGPVLFRHQRVGKNRQPITIYKFRTMSKNATEELPRLLAEDPALKEEWETYGKLDNDPRITRIGRWLRQTSLDELPQLFNVLQGNLALVGPRPVIEEELAVYGEDQDLFDRVMPGLTGFWQVSGRNHLSYADRVRLDNYYANNWSIWLDLYILAKTIFAVLFRHGAR